jgi:pilus assembly protein Flp/PilA
MKKIYEFLKDESGQTSTEYILLVAVVAVIIFKFKDTLSQKLDSLLGNVFNKADGLVQGM